MKAEYTEAVIRRSSIKNMFLNIWQTSQENTCARASGQQFYKKETMATGVFLCIFRNFQEHLFL